MFGFGRAASGIKNLFNKEVRDTNRAVREDARLSRLENQEEHQEAEVKKELGAFFSSMKREGLLMKDLTALETTKYSLVRALNAFDAAKRNLSTAKKKVISTISIRGRTIANVTRTQAAKGMGQAARGGAAIARGLMAPGLAPGGGPRFDNAAFSDNLQRYTEVHKRHVQLLANEVAVQINENRQEYAKANRLIDKNGEISKKLHEFESLISGQTSELNKARDELLAEGRKERLELRQAQWSYNDELRALGESKLVDSTTRRRSRV